MQFTNKKLLIFDLDGTLINSAPDLALAVNYMLGQIGQGSYSDALIHEWVGNGALTLVRRALSGAKEIDESLETDFVDNAL
ncbi:MAG: HAD hydrolase-like protein, partial [Sulfurovum sp.]|nr:HAD hydrolase-like protein [Sulfurovum sp.]